MSVYQEKGVLQYGLPRHRIFFSQNDWYVIIPTYDVTIKYHASMSRVNTSELDFFGHTAPSWNQNSQHLF